MKIIIITILLAVCLTGCGFLTPVQKLDTLGRTDVDATGNQVYVAAGSQYLETAQGVLQVASGFPLFGGIASGIASLLGMGVLVSNRMASNRKTALAATITGINSFTETFDKIKSDILDSVSKVGNSELTARVDELLDSLSVKKDVSTEARVLGIWRYLDTLVQAYRKDNNV